MSTEMDILNNTRPPCTFPDCDRPRARSNGLCGGHDKQRSLGKELRPLRKSLSGRDVVDVVAEFWSKVDPNGPVPSHDPSLGPCWVWTGWIKENGYGDWMVRGMHVYPHRMAWAIEHHALESTDVVDHRCWNHACARASHLRLTTKTGNGRNRSDDHARGTATGYRNVEKVKAAKTYCVRLTTDQGRIYVGKIPTAEEANQIAIELRKKHYPESQW